MRHIVAIAGVALLLGCSPARVTTPSSEHSPAPPASNSAAPVATAPSPAPRVDFVTQIRPLLESRCMPCHFEGGKVFDLLPFDRPQTIRTLGTKMFTRITDDAGKTLISAFLAGSASSSADE